MFKAIARFSVRFRWLIIIFWIVMVPVTSSVFPKLDSVTKNSTQDFLPKNTPTSQATELESVFQKKDTASSAIVVASRSDGRLTAQDNAALQKIIGVVRSSSDVTEVRDLGVSADGNAHQYLVGISGAAFGNDAITIVKNIRADFNLDTRPAGLQINLTGDLAAGVDQENANSSGRDKTEIYSVVLILVLLLLVFRALLAPIVTLVPAVLALLISMPVIAESTKAGVQVGFITQIMLIVLILGAGTDYGLFLVFRVREEMRSKGLNSKDAVVEALGLTLSGHKPVNSLALMERSKFAARSMASLLPARLCPWATGCRCCR